MENENETYNGWKNYQTWNVALHINNDPFWQEIALNSAQFFDFVVHMRTHSIVETPDEVALNDTALDRDRLEELIQEIKEGA